MSDTPRTDVFCRTVDHTAVVGGKIYQATIETVDASFARLLERELAEARAEIEHLRQELRDNSTLAARQIVPAEMLVDDLAAEIERKDAIIEQMREALRLADDLIDEYAAVCEHADNVDELRDEIKAALSAAERGGG